MTMAKAKSEDGTFEIEYPQGVPYSAWNFNICTMLTTIKKTCFGQVKSSLSNLIQQLLPGTTKNLLEHSTCLELDNCFFANQRFDAERVGSMPEDVPIIQPIMQPIDAKGEDIMRDVALSFECDYNLCLKGISASEKIPQTPELEFSLTTLQLQVVPSMFPGHVELEVRENVDLTSDLQNVCVANRGRRLFSSELLIEQMFSVLTIVTSILNVHRILHHHKTNNRFREEDKMSLSNYLQYVGQAGPAVHVVTCISDLSDNCRHLFLTEDVSLSVPCREWPSCAKDWINRERPSGWPTQQLIDKVIQDRCHVVPKFETLEETAEPPNNKDVANDADDKLHHDGCHLESSTNSEIASVASKPDELHVFPKFEKTEKSQEAYNNHKTSDVEENMIKNRSKLVPKFVTSQESSIREVSSNSATGMSSDTQSHGVLPKTLWRYSFSVAEKTLMTSITEEQKLCYLIFKYLFSKYIKLDSVITTYTAKTIFLWKLETVSADEWSLQLIGDRVKDLVEDLRTCVKKKYCQHYFIRESNTLQQMDNKSRDITLENGFSLLDEHMSDAPILGSETFKAPSDFPVDFMFTYKSFYVINAWLESLNAQMLAKLDAPSKLPSEQNVAALLDRSKTHPILMSEILKYLVLSEEIYGQSLPIPHSLLQHEKVKQLITFLEKSIATPQKYEECIRELDVELKFLHLQFKIIDELEQFFKENPNFAYQFESSSDESGAEDNELSES